MMKLRHLQTHKVFMLCVVLLGFVVLLQHIIHGLLYYGVLNLFENINHLGGWQLVGN